MIISLVIFAILYVALNLYKHYNIIYKIKKNMLPFLTGENEESYNSFKGFFEKKINIYFDRPKVDLILKDNILYPIYFRYVTKMWGYFFMKNYELDFDFIEYGVIIHNYNKIYNDNIKFMNREKHRAYIEEKWNDK